MKNYLNLIIFYQYLKVFKSISKSSKVFQFQNLIFHIKIALFSICFFSNESFVL